MNISIIGLDTSHSVEFARLLNGDGDANPGLPGLRVTRCLRFPSPFQSEPDQDTRQAMLESLGVAVTRDLAEAVAGADGIMVEINDAYQHLAYMEKVAPLGLPVFLDKPLASTMPEARRIVELVRTAKIPFWSASSLRFDQAFRSACAEVPRPVFGNVHAALGRAPAGSSIVWYGVHGAEMIVAAMGTGAATVRASTDPLGVVAVIGYPDNRRAVLELNHQRYVYSGSLEGEGAPVAFTADNRRLYSSQMAVMREFFLKGAIPVSVEQTLEVQALLHGIERSLSEQTAVNLHEEN